MRCVTMSTNADAVAAAAADDDDDGGYADKSMPFRRVISAIIPIVTFQHMDEGVGRNLPICELVSRCPANKTHRFVHNILPVPRHPQIQKRHNEISDGRRVLVSPATKLRILVP